MNSCYYAAVNPKAASIIDDPVRDIHDNGLPRVLELVLLHSLLKPSTVCPHHISVMKFAFMELQDYGVIGKLESSEEYVQFLLNDARNQLPNWAQLGSVSVKFQEIE